MSRLIRDMGGRFRDFRFADIQREADQLLDAARNEARRIARDAQRQAAKTIAVDRQSGYQEGLKQGQRDGHEQVLRETRDAALATALRTAKADVDRLVAALRAGLADFEEQKRSLIASAESELIDLALAVARRVCKTTAAASGDAARANARALLDMVQHSGDLTLHFHPEDFALIEQAGTPLVADAALHHHVKVTSDPAVERGGCVLHTQTGTIDAGITAQLERIAAALCATPTPDGAVGAAS